MYNQKFTFYDFVRKRVTKSKPSPPSTGYIAHFFQATSQYYMSVKSLRCLAAGPHPQRETGGGERLLWTVPPQTVPNQCRTTLSVSSRYLKSISFRRAAKVKKHIKSWSWFRYNTKRCSICAGSLAPIVNNANFSVSLINVYWLVWSEMEKRSEPRTSICLSSKSSMRKHHEETLW